MYIRPQKKKTVVIGLDGTPFSLLQLLTRQGICPHISALLSAGSFMEMKSTHPAVSSVAWTSFMTGKNPAKHGIFGFMDRVPYSYDIYYPNSRDIKSKSIWEILSGHRKRSIVINVPSTYPASEINGILVAGFVATDLTRAIFPPTVTPFLKKSGYKIDVETQLIQESKDRFLDDLFLTLERRIEAILYFIRNELFDLFIAVFTETDRLHHFFWECIEKYDPVYSPLFFECYKHIDACIGRLMEYIDKNTTLILLSDHGFCAINQEVYINHWLREEGFLNFTKIPPPSLHYIREDSVAYCLDPGRLYINLKGREPKGCVEPGKDYEQLRETLISGLTGLKAPAINNPIIDKVHKREEIYYGAYFDRAPDLVIEPKHGYDTKGNIYKETLFHKGIFSGMHTYDDAFLYINQKNIVQKPVRIVDIAATILDLLGIPVPEDMDGINFVQWN